MDFLLSFLGTISILVIGIAVFIVAVFLLAFVLAKKQLFFTFMKEGTVKYVVRGPAETGAFDHIIMTWRGHYLNDPRSPNFVANIAPWEVLPCANATDTVSAYPPGSPWRLFEYFGIYWFGISPFFNIHSYVFKWSEPKMNAVSHKYEAWQREERTQINFVSDFVYWAHLDAAEDKDNVPVSLDYLLTTAITNPYTARFGVSNWLTRLTADTNNAAKIWVGESTFEDIVKEVRSATAGGSGTAPVSGFVERQKGINVDLPTDHSAVGAPKSLGVTVRASSLQEVEIAGRDQEAILTATTAKLVAEKTAEALVVTAGGDKQAKILRAEGDKQAAILKGEGDAKAVETVYAAVKSFGNTGLLLAQLDAMSKANAAGGTIVWANNPFMANSGLADLLQRMNISPADLMNLIKNPPNTGSAPAAT